MESIFATLPESKPFMSCPSTKLKAPGDVSSILIKSFVASVIFKLTGTYEVPTNANNFSPILNLDASSVTLNVG